MVCLRTQSTAVLFVSTAATPAKLDIEGTRLARFTPSSALNIAMPCCPKSEVERGYVNVCVQLSVVRLFSAENHSAAATQSPMYCLSYYRRAITKSRTISQRSLLFRAKHCSAQAEDKGIGALFINPCLSA